MIQMMDFGPGSGEYTWMRGKYINIYYEARNLICKVTPAPAFTDLLAWMRICRR
jgi:hypothetical protein